MPPAARRSVRGVPLPFRTFGDILAQGLVVDVWCTRCKSWGRADLTGRHGQRFAGARFRCEQCGSVGLPSLGKQRLWPGKLADHARKLR